MIHFCQTKDNLKRYDYSKIMTKYIEKVYAVVTQDLITIKTL